MDSLIENRVWCHVTQGAARAGARPEPDITVSQWADQRRVLTSRSSSLSGPWQTSQTPYLREPMDELSPSSRTQELVLVFGSQLGKTETGLNWTGLVIDLAPGPMLMVQPTTEIARRFSKQRLAPLIEDTPALAKKVRDPRERDSGNTVLMKETDSMVLMLAGSNSPAGLKSMPIRYAFGDEIDTWPLNVGGEGDPIELVKARQRTFPNRKALWTSTPTNADTSRVWLMWLESSQARYLLPCPHCGHRQTIDWERIVYDIELIASIPPVLMCEGCGTGIPETAKSRWYGEDMGIWEHEHPERELRGYGVSSLYAPLGWYSWIDAAHAWEKAKDNAEKTKVFQNTVLGIPYKESGDVPEWEDLYRRRESYGPDSLSNKALMLTAGADVQRSPGRIEVEVVAWGLNMESWSVGYWVFQGDTGTIQTDADKQCPWRDLAELNCRVFKREDGTELPIARLAVDSSDQTQIVYQWVRQQRDGRIMAIKGRGNQLAIVTLPKDVDVKGTRGRRDARGIKLWSVGVDTAKTELYGWLGADPPLDETHPTPRGFAHFPQYDKDHFLGLTAEQLTLTKHRGYPVWRWEKIRPRNEQLDCRVYARAALASMGADRWTDENWEAKAGRFTRTAMRKVLPSKYEAPVAPKPSRKREGGWLSRDSGRWT